MDYVELHCHSNFSLLDGASPPEALVTQAADLGMPALVLTDHDAVCGAVRFSQAAQAADIKPILGAELSLNDDSHLILLVENAKGWHNLNRLISQARANASKGQAALPVELLAGHTGGLITLSGCSQGAISLALRRGGSRKGGSHRPAVPGVVRVGRLLDRSAASPPAPGQGVGAGPGRTGGGGRIRSGGDQR